MNRAMGVLNRLLRKGVSPNQLSAVGRGEFAPASEENPDSKETRALNRRVEFVVVPKMSSLDTNP
jgi:outer membrane protein OmpA-like peptidoglycan-associated protein